MKNRIPSFLAGALTACIIGGLGLTALAAAGTLTITVDPINIEVNGETFQPQDVNGKDVMVFAYQGTTYAPLRALAEAYNLEVGYDSEKNLATVVKPGGNTENNNGTEDNTSVPKLSEMTYEEFKGSLTLTMEIGERRESPDDINAGLSYYYYLSFGYGIDEEVFLIEWDKFMEGTGTIFLNELYSEYAMKAPYNIVLLHFECNGTVIKSFAG